MTRRTRWLKKGSGIGRRHELWTRGQEGAICAPASTMARWPRQRGSSFFLPNTRVLIGFHSLRESYHK